MDGPERYDCVVAGAGPAGLAAACLLAAAGLRVAAVGPVPPLAEPEAGRHARTVALMQPSIRLLEALDLWPGTLLAVSAPLARLRIVDDTGGLVAAPTVTFDAAELGGEPFGWNIPLVTLTLALRARAAALGAATIAAELREATPSRHAVRMATADGRAVEAAVAVAADGRGSILRDAAGIAARRWSYPQTALALSFAHSEPHGGLSIEYHKPEGPFTTVPLPGNRSSLVWMVRPERAAELAATEPTALARRLQLEMHGDLGLVGDVSEVQAVPMEGLGVPRYADRRIFLIGEAAHVVPPIGAQGLNMSLRDAAAAAETIADARRLDDDPGGPAALAAYDARRRADVAPRQAVIDTLNRSLLAGYAPLHALRSLGLAALDAIAPLRRLAMRQGLAPTHGLPRVMRG